MNAEKPQSFCIVVYGRVLPLTLCAALATLEGDWERSARYEGAARFQFVQLGWYWMIQRTGPTWSPSALGPERLGDVAFEQAREAGRSLPLHEMLRQVQQYLSQEQ